MVATGRAARCEVVLKCSPSDPSRFAGETGGRRLRLSERSEFTQPPGFSRKPRFSPQGRGSGVAFFCLLFLGEARKVSGMRGRPPP